MTPTEAEAYIRGRVHELYYGQDMNCARTTLTCLGEILETGIEGQTMDAALGMHGAGGFRAQCGLVEGALMFIGIAGKKAGMTDPEIVSACYQYARAFTDRFGGLTCAFLRTGGFRDDDPPHRCEKLTGDAICFALRYVREMLHA